MSGAGPHEQGERRERRDARPKPLFLAGAGLLAVMGLAMLAARVLLNSFARADGARETPHPMAARRGRAPGPVLEAHPGDELLRQRAWEDETLSTYGWIDPLGGVVRVPLDRAVELVLAAGLPARAAALERDR
jgi:hypothetical protein